MSNHSSSAGTILVGGTGKTGRRVAPRLVQAGHRTRIGSRTVELPFAWEDRNTWQPALEGVAGVQRALGRAPGSFIDYVRRTAATGVWNGRHA